MLTDVPMTFFVALTLLLSLRAYEKGTVAAFAWAGAAAGLAAATKYNGLIALVMPLCAAYAATTDSGGGRLTRGLAAGGACVAAFVIGAPSTILDLPTFLNQYAALAGHYRPVGRATDPNWLVYLKHLRDQLGWPALRVRGRRLRARGVPCVHRPGAHPFRDARAVSGDLLLSDRHELDRFWTLPAPHHSICVSHGGHRRRVGRQPAASIRLPA